MTNGSKINTGSYITRHNPHILVAPLDWGLGHATRCIPIIQALIQRGARVTVAGEGKVDSLLRTEFPHLDFLPLKGYRVSYSAHRLTLPLTIASQIPKILSAIHYEQQWLQSAVAAHRFNGIVSDNRYGLHHAQVPTAFVTHQLQIKSGSSSVADAALHKLNYRYINRFSTCWIPDHASANNLGGDLSHPRHSPSIPCHFLGPLSRFRKREATENKGLVLLLSGPEPQRTILEKKLLSQLSSYTGPVTLVRGLPQSLETLSLSKNIEVYNHLPAAQLQDLLQDAEWVVARSGYSTVMDLAAMGKKSILIPTPGQGEQEYLARHLMNKGYALCIHQEKFRLQQAIDLALSFNYHPFPESDDTALSAPIDQWLEQVQRRM